MKGITIIIPTMWYHKDMLLAMLHEYHNCDLVTQILIINNREEGSIKVSGEKIKVIGTGENIFVNQAWNLGVSEAITDKVILANDDIWIKNVCTLIYKMNALMTKGKVVGLSPESFAMNGVSTNPDRVTGMTYGFGVFMGISKASYQVIPKEFKVWYGDAIQWVNNKAITITQGVYTEMGGTSKKLDLTKERKAERIAWNNYIK